MGSSNMFGDLKTAAGVKALDAFLADNSYIEGYVPSQADTAVFEALKGAPGSDTPHAQRWYNHIKSFAAGMKQFAKASKDASASWQLEDPPQLPPRRRRMTTAISSGLTRTRRTLRRSRRSWRPNRQDHRPARREALGRRDQHG